MIKTILPLLLSLSLTLTGVYGQNLETASKQIDSVITTDRHNQSPHIFFSMLYKTMFTGIKNAQLSGHFTDTVLITHIQYHFTNKYIKALAAYKNNDSLAYCWRAALDTTLPTTHKYVQWLALGTNAHINHDLFFILLDYYKTYGATGNGHKKALNEFLRISNAETNRIINNFLATDPQISRWEALLIRTGKGRVKKQMEQSLETTWQNALEAAKFPGKEAEITQKQLQYAEETAQKYQHPRGAIKKGLSILGSLDALPFETRLQMLQPVEK